MRILETPPHLHLHFVDKRLAIANVCLYLPRRAEERAKLARPPASECRLVLALKVVPPSAGSFQACHRLRAFRRHPFAQRFLIGQHDIPRGTISI
jgi:hypothetical protein